MKTDSYLRRIKYDGDVTPSLVTLRRLHRAHLLAVPFENLDIHLGTPIVLEPDAMYTKIIERRRGGFCYELNGSFAWLLRELGFEVTMLSARVGGEQEGFGPEFDHMALLVQLDEPWLADVGFGDGFLEPIPLGKIRIDGALTWIDRDGSYRVTRGEDYELLWQARDSEEWRPQYRFTRQPRELADFNGMCLFHQTSPESHFTQGRISTRATEDGRITLSEMHLIVTKAGIRDERVLADEAERQNALSEYFGIDLSGD